MLKVLHHGGWQFPPATVFVWFCVSALLLSPGCRTVPPPQLHRFEYASPHMGTRFRITLYAESEAQAEEATQAAFERVAALEDLLSDYMADSELMRLAGSPSGEPVAVSDDLFFVLQHGSEISALTDGAFDLTSGPFTRLWRFSRKRGVLPPERELATAREAVGWEKIALNEHARTATPQVRGMRLDAGGIAKGYAADEAMRVLQEHGIERSLIAASGDILASQPPPGTKGWRVAVASPGPDQNGSHSSGGLGASLAAGNETSPQTLLLSNSAISTSGDTQQFALIEGVYYSHIVSPFTGLGLTNRIQATVIAPHATTSDALATACCILGPQKAIELVDSLPKVAVIVMTKEGAETRVWRSKRAP